MPNFNVSDKEIAEVILGQHKLEASSMMNLIIESSNDSVRTGATSILQKTFNHQKQIFDLMNQKGWYQTQSASAQDIATAKQSVNNVTS